MQLAGSEGSAVEREQIHSVHSEQKTALLQPKGIKLQRSELQKLDSRVQVKMVEMEEDSNNAGL